MENDEFKSIGLYNHNALSYKKIKDAYENGKKIVSIVHATGTGKSYNALQLSFDNKDKKIIYIVPSNSIREHIEQIIEDNPNLNLKKDFPNLEFRTYQSLVTLNDDEIENLDCDLLILDEFHHIGAPIWGEKIDKMVSTHPQMKIFGMTAYTIRDRETSYERDMLGDDELFEGSIVSNYDLCDAMIDDILPKPIYRSAYINLEGEVKNLEEKVEKMNHSKSEYTELKKILESVKKRIHEAPGIPDLLSRNIKSNGKYIYFCPTNSLQGVNDIETIKCEALEWFKTFISEENIEIYTTTSDMGIEGKKNRDAFYNDVTLDGKSAKNKLKIMFAINQYNEGVHAPNIDGVILGRGTKSDIVFYEQLGRALSVRGNTKEKRKELEKYSIDELKEICKIRKISFHFDAKKEDLIEKLISPVIIDLTNNIEYIKELENKIKDKTKKYYENNTINHIDVEIKDVSFDIELINDDLFEFLKYVKEKLNRTWDDWYELAKVYYEHYGDLEIPTFFKTTNGYDKDEKGYALGYWLSNQRQKYKKGLLNENEIRLLKNIGVRFENKTLSWDEMYELVKKYYEKYGDLNAQKTFKTLNGYEYNEDGVIINYWIFSQRRAYKLGILNDRRIELLKAIGMNFNSKVLSWDEMYEFAKKYYKHYGNLNIPEKFKTKNGYEYDNDGYPLGSWIRSQKKKYRNSMYNDESKEIIELKKIGYNFEENKFTWNDWFKLAQEYYNHNGNLNVEDKFKTINGYEYDSNGYALGSWVRNQKQKYFNDKYTDESEEVIKLKNIGCLFEHQILKWNEWYKLATEYYNYHGNLDIKENFKTLNGYEYDENGYNLYNWTRREKKNYFNGKYTDESKEVIELKTIGMKFYKVRKYLKWDEWYKLAYEYYKQYGNLDINCRFKTLNGYEYDDDGYNLGGWIRIQYNNYKNKEMSFEKIDLLEKIGMNWFSTEIDEKLQKEEITDANHLKKEKELLNRLKSILLSFDGQMLPAKDEINNSFVKKLNMRKKD